ncbi:hypothetical protein NXY39_20955 [Bacteroides fragilis]|nr:hypothetical protein [Bacteroides fragilis]
MTVKIKLKHIPFDWRIGNYDFDIITYPKNRTESLALRTSAYSSVTDRERDILLLFDRVIEVRLHNFNFEEMYYSDFEIENTLSKESFCFEVLNSDWLKQQPFDSLNYQNFKHFLFGDMIVLSKS